MKKLLTRASALILSVSLICMNAVPAFAADKTVPTAAAVTEQAVSTADYLLTQDDFSDLSTVSKFYHASQDLILAIRAGADTTNAQASYLAAAAKLLNADGTLKLTVGTYDNKNELYSSYAYLLTVLALTGKDATSFNNVNVVSAFSEILNAASADDFVRLDDYSITNLSPYYIGIVYSAVNSYAELIENSDAIIAKIKAALLKISDAKGVIYYSEYSADTNGSVYSAFSSLYKKDAAVKTAIDSAVNYTHDTFFSEADGTTHYISEAYGMDYASGDSTALALSLYSQFDQPEYAAMSYNALLTFKLNDGTGAYDGYDPVYASQNALNGLVTYMQSLKGLAHPFDVTKEVAAIVAAKNNAEKETESTTEQTTAAQTTTQATTAQSTTQASTQATTAQTTAADTELTAAVTTAQTAENNSTASNTASGNVQNETPATGDHNSLAILLAMCTVSATAVALTAVKRKRA